MTDDTSQDQLSMDDVELKRDRKYREYLERESENGCAHSGCVLILQKAGLSDCPPKPVTAEIIKQYHDAGVISKSELIDGSFYWGLCRNAPMARWDSQKQVFWYIRDKWHDTYAECINTIEDDNGYDLFLPFKKVIW